MDLLDNAVCSFLADIVHDDIGAKFGKHQGVRPTETRSGTGDDGGLALEFDFGRRFLVVG